MLIIWKAKPAFHFIVRPAVRFTPFHSVFAPIGFKNKNNAAKLKFLQGYLLGIAILSQSNDNSMRFPVTQYWQYYRNRYLRVKIKAMKTLKIIGISVETTNQNNQSAIDLGQLWQRFYTEEIFKKINNKEGEEVYAVYTDYESDYTGKYTTIIGQSVNSLDNIPEGLVGREIKNENLKKYVAKGEMPAAVVQTWQQIWADDSNLYRSYEADFEVYGDKCQNGNQSEVEIFIGIA